jgi:hypothetical protein
MTEPVINHAGSNNETFSFALDAQWMLRQELTANAQPSLCVIQRPPFSTGLFELGRHHRRLGGEIDLARGGTQLHRLHHHQSP